MYKLIAKSTEYLFFFVILSGFISTIFLSLMLVVKSWTLFVNSKGGFLEWLKVWNCKKYIQENYKFALFMETLLEYALENIPNKTIRNEIKAKLKDYEGRK